MCIVLSAKNIKKNYTSAKYTVEALKETDLSINKGEIIVIVGKSGSGKSTLLNVLGGLMAPDNGDVIINDKSIYDISETERAKIRNLECGFIFQNFNLINELSVLNNIRLPFDIAGKKYNKELEDTILELLNLEDRKTFYPNQLSGGEKQRTAIARTMLMKPSIILADEPTGNLDMESGKNVMDLVKKINEIDKQTYVIVTHDMEWTKIAQKVYKMSDGVLSLQA